MSRNKMTEEENKVYQKIRTAVNDAIEEAVDDVVMNLPHDEFVVLKCLFSGTNIVEEFLVY